MKVKTKTEATIEELYRVPDGGKAEIVDGEIVLMAPTGFTPGRAGDEIANFIETLQRV